MTARKPLDRYRRIVIKIGSALLVDRKTGLKKSWLDGMCADIAALKAKGIDVLVVSSGAIALGRSVLDLPSGALKLEESQAAAAVGQISLARAWSESLSHDDIVAGQILLTLGDTEERRRYLNARATINQLLKIGAVPIINENDTVATSEIRYGDNDRLAARVATMTGADLLILLSDIDGLYTAPPHLDPQAKFLDAIAEITPEIEAMAGGAASELSRGGMRTKIDAGKIATGAGCAMIIASGKTDRPLNAIENGARSSWFAPSGTPVTARKTWIAGQLQPAGELHV
ncbi:MAG TPA: glutamate 5-kinase, partial [Rhizobium sp.]|nr:glutamate 5-kinase [Rhizobium sp.]